MQKTERRIFNHNRGSWNILIFGRIKILKEHITEKYKEDRSKRINLIAQEIRKNVGNGGKIWEPKWKLEKKAQTPYSITNTE